MCPKRLPDSVLCIWVRRASVQAAHAQCNDLGFFPLPTTTKAAALSLSSFTLATSSSTDAALHEPCGALQWVFRCVTHAHRQVPYFTPYRRLSKRHPLTDQTWAHDRGVCFMHMCFFLLLLVITLMAMPQDRQSQYKAVEGLVLLCRTKPSTGKSSLAGKQLLTCTVAKVETPGEADSVDVTLVSQALQMRLSPAFCHMAAALAAHVTAAMDKCSTDGVAHSPDFSCLHAPDAVRLSNFQTLPIAKSFLSKMFTECLFRRGWIES